MKNLEDFPLFRELNSAERTRFLSTCRTSVILPKEALIVQGTRGDRLYFVTSGTLRVVLRTNQEEHEIALINAPAVLGEMEFLTHSPRTATVRAVTVVHLVEATYETLDAQMADGDSATLKVFARIAQVVARRLADMNERILLMSELPSVRPKELQTLHKKLFEEWSL